MIGYSEYREQLLKIYQSAILQDWSCCQQVFYRGEDDSIILQTIVPSHAVISAALANVKLAHLEFKITYTSVYQEPQLLLRLWQKKNLQLDKLEFEDDMLTPWFPPNVQQILGIVGQFQLGLDTVATTMAHKQEAWYSIHPCDTADIVGNQENYSDKYLSRWLSVFLFSWVNSSENDF